MKVGNKCKEISAIKVTQIDFIGKFADNARTLTKWDCRYQNVKFTTHRPRSGIKYISNAPRSQNS